MDRQFSKGYKNQLGLVAKSTGIFTCLPGGAAQAIGDHKLLDNFNSNDVYLADDKASTANQITINVMTQRSENSSEEN